MFRDRQTGRDILRLPLLRFASVPAPDVHSFSRACSALFAPGLTLGSFASRSFDFLQRLVSAEFIACGVLETRQQRLTIGFDTPHPDFSHAMAALGALMNKYPLFRWDASVNHGRPFCRSHFYTRRQFAQLDVYREVYQPLGIDNHCAVHVPTRAGETLFFGLERAGGPDFSADDLALLELAQHHLADAHALCRTFAGHSDDAVEPAILTSAGLTPREAETLFWLNEGKSNHETALLLGIGLYTVKAHIASIFNKTGTGNRLAAIVWARQTCRRFRESPPQPAGFVDVPARLV